MVKPTRGATWLSLTVLLLLTVAIYSRPSFFAGSRTLFGWDFTLLHMRRLAFLRDSLATAHAVPAWYPRELLGTPFSANLQDLPWLPTHWLLLLPPPEKAFFPGVALAAALTALFTYLFSRRAGLSQLASIVAGWTFACSGFFAARVMIGQLLILETFAALPLLLWLADRAADFHRRDLLILAAAIAVIISAGHPQLPAYSVAAAIAYVAWRTRGKLRVQLLSVMMLAIGASLAAWWPMFRLIGRSTRTLPLDPSANDVSLPYHRLLALIAPGIDGWPLGVEGSTIHAFTRYPHVAYFWDTFAYVGLLPLAAVVALTILRIRQRRRPDQPFLFLAILGAAALICALPFLDPLRHMIPGTIFRSPARLLYLTTFALSIALGAGLDELRRIRAPWLAVLALLAFHAVDLGRNSSRFVLATDWHPLRVPEFETILDHDLSDGRIATARILSLGLLKHADDAGAYDSIFLAAPYQELIRLTGSPAGLNEEVLDASTWPLAALQATGVRFVITPATRTDLPLAASAAGLQMYRVPNARARVSLAGGSASDQRNGPDRMTIRSSSVSPGNVEILESPDPGWTAKVDGAETAISAKNGITMAIPVPSGEHQIDLRYRTPGRLTGWILSLLSMIALYALARGFFRNARNFPASEVDPANSASNCPSPSKIA
jgi:Bacterial membrane protein YfhO